MTKEESELVLKDLCARLPYGVKLCVYEESDKPEVIWSICTKDVNPYISTENWVMVYPKDVKPYLRPMSSMTREEEAYWNYHRHMVGDGIFSLGYDNPTFCIFECFEWLNSHHFDYGGLIIKGLALEAPEGMYDN